MTRRSLILIAAGGSAALLLGALAFQYVGGLAPCTMCIWQRWPHAAAIALGGVGAVFPAAFVAVAGGMAALTTAGIGVFHVGVEQAWWEGPSTCTSGNVTGMSTGDLMEQIMTAPLVRCDEIAWSLAGISMAGWNAIASLALAVIWIAAARQASSR